jgi:CRISPR-associated protein Cas1
MKPENLPQLVRRRVRDEIASRHLLERMVKDIHLLFLGEDEDKDDIPGVDVTYLWDTKEGTVSNGRSYSEE